jgi:hypothetical protein
VSRRGAVAALLVGGVVAGGCGGEAGDLMLVERSGSIPGARLQLRFTVDGRVGCSQGAGLRELTSAQTIDARAIERALAGDEQPGPAARHVSLAPGPGSILRYRASMEAGSVAFSDTSRGQPPAFFRLAKLTRDVSRDVCGNRR